MVAEMGTLRDIRNLNLNCREATRLTSEARERRLTRWERAGLTIHLGLCRYCRRYRRQLAYLRDVVKTIVEEPAAMSESAKARIRRKLEESS
jgi:predicted anti-sigma-YlaC factor YlaD